MRISTDFECGGGKRLQVLGERHWRVEAAGDQSGYDKYFCVRVTAEPTEPDALLRLDVHPDSDVGEAGARYFASHFPSHVWVCQGEWPAGMAQRDVWVPLRHVWEDAVTFRERAIELRIPLKSGATLYVASNPPRRYSDLLGWTESLRAAHPDRVEVGSIGRSAEGREILLVRRRGRQPGLPRFLVLAGQHPSEHSGVWASEGVVDWALSPIGETRQLCDQFDLAVIPMINPDGNVHGLSGANAEGIDLCEDWAGVAAAGCCECATGSRGAPGSAADLASAPRATENRLLWRWLRTQFPPDVFLDLHGGLGWRALADPPYDGAVLFVKGMERLCRDPRRVASLRALQARFMFETPGHLGRGDGSQVLGEEFLEYQVAAAFGTLAVLYHINAGSVGALEQYRRGPQIVAAMARALVRDAGFTSLFRDCEGRSVDRSVDRCRSHASTSPSAYSDSARDPAVP